MKVRLKVLLYGMLLAVLIVAPTGLALASSAGSAPREVAAQTEDPEEGDDNSDSPYCTGEAGERQHPVAANIAATYQVGYGEVIGYFCDGYGFGEIMLAYVTGEFAGTPPTDLLDMKGKGHAWGRIWKELGLIGNERDGSAAPSQGRGKPDWAGKPDHANGPPNTTQGNDNQNCPGNSCNNPGQGNDKNNDDSENDNSTTDQGTNNGSQDRGNTDDADDTDTDS
jgi:hypothetical protein